MHNKGSIKNTALFYFVSLVELLNKIGFYNIRHSLPNAKFLKS